MFKPSSISNFSYKILTATDALIFNRTGCFIGNMRDRQNGFIQLATNLKICETILHKFHRNQSVAIYKLDNDKLTNVKEYLDDDGITYLKYNGVLRKDQIICKKYINHDNDDILAYLNEINDLKVSFGEEKIQIKEYAIKY
jgi:hypothetical protein